MALERGMTRLPVWRELDDSGSELEELEPNAGFQKPTLKVQGKREMRV